MERTTVYLDKPLKRLLKRIAKARGVTEAELIREALRKQLSAERASMPRVVGRSSDGGVAHRFDDALEAAGFGRSDPG